MTKSKNLIKLIVTLLVCQAAGFIGSLFTTPAIPVWYTGLNKPVFTPPSWLFGPVWITLYLMMGVALFLVWRKGFQEKKNRTGIFVFILQLVLNTLWSILFFGMRSPLAGFMEIILLWILILITLILFYRISKAAGILLLPYLIWVTFAAVLNGAILTLN